MARTTMMRAAHKANPTSYSPSILNPNEASAVPHAKPPPRTDKYPGFGLPLRHRNDHGSDDFYPIGAHGSNYAAKSEPISVRELAMMDVMEKLTDKPDWQKKVFNEQIITKWGNEALAIPDEHLWNLAVSGKYQYRDHDGMVQVSDDNLGSVPMPENILDNDTFDIVGGSSSL
jgi:hypothetical protein